MNKFIKLLTVTNKPSDRLSLKDLYNVYYQYCVDNDTPAIGKVAFADRIATTCAPKVSLGGNVTGFRGIKLSDDLEWYL